jgi:hypothetical protein
MDGCPDAVNSGGCGRTPRRDLRSTRPGLAGNVDQRIGELISKRSRTACDRCWNWIEVPGRSPFFPCTAQNKEIGKGLAEKIRKDLGLK